MAWAHKWGEAIKSGFYYQLLSKGMLKEEDKELDLGPFQFYLDAFSELSTTRQAGFGFGPIPFTAIVEYADRFGVEDFEEFLYLIRRMDNTLVDLESNKVKAQGGKSGGSNNHSKHQNRGHGKGGKRT